MHISDMGEGYVLSMVYVCKIYVIFILGYNNSYVFILHLALKSAHSEINAFNFENMKSRTIRKYYSSSLVVPQIVICIFNRQFKDKKLVKLTNKRAHHQLLCLHELCISKHSQFKQRTKNIQIGDFNGTSLFISASVYQEYVHASRKTSILRLGMKFTGS